MKNYRLLRGISLTVFIFLCNIAYGQVVLGDTNLSIPLDNTECTTISVGESAQFARTSNCTGNILIQLNGVAVLNTNASAPNFTFKDPGEYIVFCGASPDLVAVPKACFTVVGVNSIPTLGEWGVSCLLLLISIMSVVSLRSNVRQANLLR